MRRLSHFLGRAQDAQADEENGVFDNYRFDGRTVHGHFLVVRR